MSKTAAMNRKVRKIHCWCQWRS